MGSSMMTNVPVQDAMKKSNCERKSGGAYGNPALSVQCSVKTLKNSNY